MSFDSTTILLLCLAALILALIGVLLDRLNFPQSRFRPRQIKPSDKGPVRDRTGAHIVDVDANTDADIDIEAEVETATQPRIETGNGTAGAEMTEEPKQ